MTKPSKPAAAPPSAAEIAAEFDRQREELRSVKVLLSSRAADRNRLLLTAADDAVIEYDRRTTALELRRDRAAAQIESLRHEHPIAVEREEEAKRVALRAAAEQKREFGASAYLRLEQKLREVAADLAIVFAADEAIANANANRAKDTPPLLPVEADFRWVDAVPDRIEPVTRTRRVPRDGHWSPNMTGAIFDETAVTENRTIPGRPAVRPAALYDVLEIPALRPGDEPLRVPGTPVSAFLGHRTTKLTPPPALPADDVPAATGDTGATMPRPAAGAT